MKTKLKCKVLYALMISASAVLLASCIDESYDLSDIDTTTRVSVDSLNIPVNLDEIYLKNIIDTANNDISLIDGMYAIEKTGKFRSGDIKVSSVHLNAPSVPMSHLSIDTSGAEQSLESTGSVTLPIGTKDVSFSYSTGQVSDEIISIDDIGTELTISFVMGFDDIDNKVSAMTFRDIVLQLPKGMTVDASRTTGSYNADSGELKVPAKKVMGTGMTITIVATKIDSRAGYVMQDHKITYKDELKVKSGNVVIEKSDLKVPASQLPKTLQYGVRYLLSNLDIVSFSGKVQYTISGINHPEIHTGALPKLLSQSGTDITLVNPQIYLTVNNPASSWGVYGTTGMSITPYRKQGAGETFSIPAGSIVIPAMDTPNERAIFCLSPEKPDKYLINYEKSKHIPYPNLGDVLSGNGIPNILRVEMLQPEMPAQLVKDFPVGVNIGRLEGEYNFYFPFEMGVGSKIIYSATETGWGSEDLDKLVITRTHVRAYVTSNAPLALHFSGYPLDRDGNCINGLEIQGADVPAYANNYPIDIYINGEITNLDGFEFTAMSTTEYEKVLNDNMFIKLDGLKVCVSAYYTTTL